MKHKKKSSIYPFFDLCYHLCRTASRCLKTCYFQMSLEKKYRLLFGLGPSPAG